METVNSIMQQAVAGKIFPGGTLLVSKSDTILFHKAYGVANIYTGETIKNDTIYDLASLTKPLATTLAILMLIQNGKLNLDQSLGTIIPALKDTPKAEIMICHLLNHTSGLPDYRRYFLKIFSLPYKSRKKALREYLAKEPLLSSVGETTCYSDLGFMLLDWVVEKVSGVQLNQFVNNKVYQPLGLKNLFFIDLEKPLPKRNYAATEMCPWRQMLLNGMVHDENAFTTGGIAGHAGLFGTAESVHKLLIELINSYRGISQKVFKDRNLVRSFLDQKANQERVFGFDVPSRKNSSCGDYFNKNTTVGHLGFTGTSFWIDLNQMVVVILLTNRIHPTRKNERIKKFRPILHNTVMKHLFTKSG